MTPERFQQIEELYHAARERTGDERAALLAETDPELRREIESLLAQPDSARFLDRPALENAAAVGDAKVTVLTAGVRLGPYRIEGKLGEGGMGKVYRARDTKLKRDVAIKILPEEFARDADRVNRFQREAHLLASLNHPNIAQIYGLEESNHTNCIIMELVEGPTLAERLRLGPLPIEDALRIGKEIAEALEAA